MACQWTLTSGAGAGKPCCKRVVTDTRYCRAHMVDGMRSVPFTLVSPPGWHSSYGCVCMVSTGDAYPKIVPCGKPVRFSNTCAAHVDMCAVLPINSDPLPD